MSVYRLVRQILMTLREWTERFSESDSDPTTEPSQKGITRLLAANKLKRFGSIAKIPSNRPVAGTKHTIIVNLARAVHSFV